MAFNETNTKQGDIFVGQYDDPKDSKFHGEIITVEGWGVTMKCPWLTSMPVCSWGWSDLNECFKKPKKLNNNGHVTKARIGKLEGIYNGTDLKGYGSPIGTKYFVGEINVNKTINMKKIIKITEDRIVNLNQDAVVLHRRLEEVTNQISAINLEINEISAELKELRALDTEGFITIPSSESDISS